MVDVDAIENKIANQDIFETFDFLPEKFVDLLILDPPYNLNKVFKSTKFKKMGISEYSDWFESWFVKLFSFF